ncbi:hypothetical protein HY492_02470 [Candidatus Woesearchaeota archaeon]|nr:hypothetical protein [Candidatus Woesearchaeota archaeon]
MCLQVADGAEHLCVCHDLPDEILPVKEFPQSSLRRGYTLQPRSVNELIMTETIWMPFDFISPSIEARSSLRRLGCYSPTQGRYFFTSEDGLHIELGNFGHNEIRVGKNDRLAQLFFKVAPFTDTYDCLPADFYDRPEECKALGERVRALDMGIQITKSKHLGELVREGHLKVTPELHAHTGLIKVHAGDVAYRMRKIDGGIVFKDRAKYSDSDLLEPIDIKKGYVAKPFEHVIVPTRESFELSPHVGIRFWDSLIGMPQKHNSVLLSKNLWNLDFMNLTDGWFDPGYKGGCSRQPKWLTGRSIYPGACLGYGQVFWFPNGVETPYGSIALGSQYQGQEKTVFAKK